MKQSILLLIFLMLAGKTLLSQTPGVEWEQCIENSSVRSAVKLSDSLFTIIFESVSCTDSPSIGMRCYDQSGIMLWEKLFIPTLGKSYHAFSLTATSDKGYIIAGSLDSSGSNYNHLIKTDSAGNIQWQKQYFCCDTAMSLAGKVIQIASGNYFYITDTYSSRRDVEVMELDQNGNTVWSKTYGGSLFDNASDAVQTDDNGYLIVAYTNSNDGNVSGNHGKRDIWVLKLNVSGNLLWQKCYGGSMDDEARSVLKLSDGYLIGGMSQSSDNDVTGHLGSTGYYDDWIFKIDFNGNLIWQKTYGGIDNDYASQLIQVADGNFLLTGSSYSSDSYITDHHHSKIYDDQWTIKINPDGTLIWQKSTGGSYDDWSNCAVALDSDNVIIGGASFSGDGDHHHSCFSNDCRPLQGGWLLRLDDHCPSYPTPLFSYSQAGFDFSFSNESYSAQSYLWDFGDGSTSTEINPEHIYLLSGSYEVCLTASDNCSSKTFCQTVITCSSVPVASFDISYPDGANVHFTSTSVDAVTLTWDFGDGSFDSVGNPVHTYSQNGTYSALLTIQDSCGNLSSQSQTVNTCLGFAVDFSFTSNENTFTFLDSSKGIESSWSWDFGDGNFSALQNPQHSYSTSGTYQVCLTVASDGCSTQTLCKDITVCLVPDVDTFTYSINLLQVSFYDSSENAATWEWNFGDGTFSTDQNPQHVFLQQGVYNVCESSSNGCGSDTFCQMVVVGCPVVQASFSYDTDNLNVSFFDASVNATVWSWNFGDGNTSTVQYPVHIYAAPGDYNVCLISGDLCTADTLCEMVHVECMVAASSFTTAASGLDAVFTDQSANATQWSWNFGDGDTSSLQNPSHIYASAGTFYVCLVAINSCSSNQYCQNISVQCPPFNAVFTTTVISDTVAFIDESANAISWQWNFGDGILSGYQNPVHVYDTTGSFEACLVAYNGCSYDTVCDTINIIPDGLIETVPNNSIFTLYPNPAHGLLTIQYHADHSSEISLRLLDLSGRENMKILEGYVNTGDHFFRLNVSTLLPGTYVVELKAADNLYIRKLVIQ